MASLQLKGKITRISDAHTADSGYQWKNFILETGTGERKNPINFTAGGKNLDIVHAGMVDKDATVDFFINGRATPKGYFNNLNAVSVSCEGMMNDNYQDPNFQPGNDQIEDDIPF